MSLVVFDLGMNEGQDTEYYLQSGYRVIAVEANKRLAQSNAVKYARAISESRLTILNVGIAEKEGMMDFWVCDDKSEWSSFDRTMAATNSCRHHAESVEVWTYARLQAEYGVPHYLKIDIEGKEHACLDQIGSRLPQYISLEAYSESDLTKLAELGYRQFKCISQYYFLSLEQEPEPEEIMIRSAIRGNTVGWLGLPRRIRLRLTQKMLRHIDGWQFIQSSTGPFGETTRGRWKSYDEMLRIFRKVRHEIESGQHIGVHCGMSPGSFWKDFHAKR